jgi:pyruvate kinase
MTIRTKVVATLGPASATRETIRALIGAGCDVFRINFSHGTEAQHRALLEEVRAAEEEAREPIAVLADLCGPKIRVAPLAGDALDLAWGDRLVIQRERADGTGLRISTTLPELVDEVRPGQAILLDDGRIRLEVDESRAPREVACRVIVGGVLRSGKGINLPHTELTVSSLTEKDRADVAWIAGRAIDYVALSFVRTADDVRLLRDLLRHHGSDARVVAKVEKPQALEHIEAIVDEADAVMVARGDLGVEMDLPEVPVVQKRIAALCQAAAKPCIIATQMLESMITSPMPTRAEVSDVANAVMDHADAVMLSGETAVGSYPVEAVRMMNRIAWTVETHSDDTSSSARVTSAAEPTVAALAGAVREIVGSLDVAAVCVYTATGTTARMLSKSRIPRPVLALAPRIETVRRLALYYGTIAMRADPPEHTRDVLALASRLMLDLELAKRGDRIVVLSGRPIARPGATNTLVVHTIG